LSLSFSEIIDRIFVFFPDREVSITPSHVGLDYKELWIRTSDKETLNAWFVKGKFDVLFLFCHGNAGDIGDRVENIAQLVMAGLSVLIFDYRGYGKSTGTPKEEGVYKDAEAVYNYAIKELNYSPEKIIVFGRSLGAAVAAHLASQVKTAGVILESAFTNLKDMAWVHYPFIPGKFLVKHKFNVLDKIKKLKAPLLIIHGEKDTIVPLWMGEKIYQQAPEPKEFYTVPEADHNDTNIIDPQAYIKRLRDFALKVAKI